MTQLERLMRLTSEGDLAAAAELRREATRRDDPRALALSCAALGDVSALVAAASSAWETSDWSRLEVLSSALGVVITQDIAARIEAILAVAHQRIRRRRAQPAHIMHAIAEATCGAQPFRSINTGHGTGGARSVVVLAVLNPDQTLTLGISTGTAQTGTPGSAWPRELSPWRPEIQATLNRLAVWSTRVAPDRIRLPILSSGDAFALLSRTSANTQAAAERAWSDKLQKAMRAPLTRAKWRQLCTLMQAPPTPGAASDIFSEFLQRNTFHLRSGDAAWLREALALGPSALPHWHLTTALALDSPTTAPLTQTCIAMQGLQEIYLNYTHVLSTTDQAQSIAAIVNSPDLTALKDLHIQGCRFDTDSAQILWADPERLPTLRRLKLREIRILPPQDPPWPPLRRPLDALTLEALTIDTPFIETALQWLHDSPHKPPECSIEGHNLTPISATPARWHLPHIQSFNLNLYPVVPSITAAILNKLDLPDLTYFTLYISELTPDIIDALAALRDRAPPRADGAQLPMLNLHENHDIILNYALNSEQFFSLYPRPWHALRPQICEKLLPRWHFFP